MEIDVYLRVIRRWLWLLVLMTLLAAGVSYMVVMQQPTSYVATTTLLVGPGIDYANADLNVQRASTQVMQTYAQLATTRNVMKQVIDKLRLNIQPNALAGQVTVTPNLETQAMSIAVRSGDPKQAVAIANAMAEVLVNLRFDQVTSSLTDSLSVANTQVKQLQDLGTRTQARITELENSLKELNDSRTKPPFTDQENKIRQLETQMAAPADPVLTKRMADRQARIQQLETALKTTVNIDARRLTLDELSREDAQLAAERNQVNEQKRIILEQLTQERNRLASMQTAVSSQQSQLVSQLAIERAQMSDVQRNLAALFPTLQSDLARKLTVIDPATNAPAETSRANLIVMAAGLAGLFLALTLAFVFEYFDDRIRTADQLAQVTGTKVWGVLGKEKAMVGPYWAGRGITSTDGAIAEAFRRWCMNLMPNGPSDVCSILVTQIEPGEAAAQVASGLAVTLARFGRRAVLIDGNLEHPTVDRWFPADSHEGVTEWLGDGLHDPKLAPVEGSPGLSVFPARTGNNNAVQQLTIPRVKELVERVQNQADMVVIAGPPLATSADSLLLASHTGGVLLVAQRGKTKKQEIRAAIENLRSLGIQVLGTILADEYSSRGRMPWQTKKRGKPPVAKRPSLNVNTNPEAPEKVISYSSRGASRPGFAGPNGDSGKDNHRK